MLKRVARSAMKRLSSLSESRVQPWCRRAAWIGFYGAGSCALKVAFLGRPSSDFAITIVEFGEG